VVGELDVDVLLVNARELAIQVIGFISLVDIKARREGLRRRLVASGTVDVVVIK
jgi:hypothetical protein